MDHRFHHLAGTFNQVDEGKQNLSVGLAELLDHGGRLACGPSHNVVRFLHGGWLLSDSCLATGILSKPAPPPPINPQLTLGHPRLIWAMRLRGVPSPTFSR